MITVEVPVFSGECEEWNALVDVVRIHDLKFVENIVTGITQVTGPDEVMRECFDLTPLNCAYSDRAVVSAASFAGSVTTPDLWNVMAKAGFQRGMVWLCHPHIFSIVFCRLAASIHGIAYVDSGGHNLTPTFLGSPIVFSGSMPSSGHEAPMIIYGPESILGLPLEDVEASGASALFLSRAP